jgi:hypothetical protein
VADDNSVAVTQGKDVSVDGLPMRADDGSLSGGNHRPGAWQRGDVLAGVETPLLIYGVKRRPNQVRT